MLRSFAFVLLASTASVASSENSKPQPVAIVDTIPAAQDAAYPGTIDLAIDATDTERGIFRVKETIPVSAAGAMTLLYPKWLPGKHGPRGEIEKLAGLKITAAGQPVPWKRDPIDMFAFHIEVPAGATRLDLEFQFVSATKADQGRVVMTPNLMSLQFNSMSLYPAGYFTRDIPVRARVTYPEGWTAVSGLKATRAGAIYSYEPTDYETLVDSPAIAGRYYREWALSPKVDLNVVADSAKELDARPEQIEAYRRMVAQAVKTFGAEHYDHYEFLQSISSELGGIGLEHHRSTEINSQPGFFADWDGRPASRNVLPHEFTHSWDGKFRRGADLWTPDFRTPMQGSLLWVYEGQTQFWGHVLQARSGLVSKQETLDGLAAIVASLDNRPARQWRAMGDTTLDPVMTARGAKGWLSWQRSEDYYNEGLLVWMEVDAMLRAKSGGKKSIDDFARAFFGIRDGDWGVVTYTFADVARTLNAIVPYDWAGFLDTRVNGIDAKAPTGGFEANGYRLVYTPEPSGWWKADEKINTKVDLSYSLGFVVSTKDASVTAVGWEGPAFGAGLTVGDTIVAVDGQAFSDTRLRAAVAGAKNSSLPVSLLVKSGDRFRNLAIDYHGGLRYPRLEKVGTGQTGLDRLLQPR